MEYSAFTFSDPSTSVCIPPPAKRSRKEELISEAPEMITFTQNCGGDSSQAWKRMRDARRASLTYLMDCGASPITLDFAIDKRIFDFTVVTSNGAGDVEKAPPLPRRSQLPPPPFSDCDTPTIRKVSSSDDTMIRTAVAATTTLHHEIEKECSASGFNKRKVGIEGSEARFRAHQTDIWVDKYEDLVQYKTKNGHCLVPNSFPPNPSLAEWVKRQRYQYKLRVAGKHSSMTDDRVAALEKLEFCWNSHDANWEDKFNELVDYKRQFGHTNVPSTSEDFPKLAVWVKRQRRQHKFLMEGQASTVTPYRKEKLESIGFCWSGRKPKKGSRSV